jgi:RNA polymerase sigma factor (sigma-70 family)
VCRRISTTDRRNEQRILTIKHLIKMENIKLIRKIAKSFHQTSGIEYDELFQEAMIGYFKAIETHDPDKGMLSTHIWSCVSNQLKNYLKREKEYADPLMSLETAINIPDERNDFLEMLSMEANEITEVFMEESDRYVVMIPVDARKNIIQSAIEKGMNLQKIWRGLNDLQVALK